MSMPPDGLSEARPIHLLALIFGALVASLGGFVFTDVAAATVDVSKPPRFVMMEISPARIRAGETAELRWRVWNADGVKLGRDSRRTLPPTGELRVTPTRSGARTYRLQAVNRAGRVASRSVSLDVVGKVGAMRPRIVAFRASTTSVRPGGSVDFNWQTEGAERVFFGTRIGSDKPALAPTRGSERRTVRKTTTYHLVAMSADGTKVERHITVRAKATPSKPVIDEFEADRTNLVSGQRTEMESP